MVKWALIGGAIVAGLITGVGVVLPWIVRKFVIYSMIEQSKPIFSATLQRVANANGVRGYAPAPDSTIAPEAAGRAYHQIVWWQSPSGTDLLMPGPDSATNVWNRAEESGIPGSPPPAAWCGDLLARASHDLSPAEVVALERVTKAQSRDTLFRIFARAPGADILGSRWTYQSPGDDPLFFYTTLPLPYLSSFRRAVRIWCGRSALQLRDGHPLDAERTLKEALRGSLQLMNEGPTILEMVTGAVLTRDVAVALANLYDATNRGDEADRLLRALETAAPIQLPGRLNEQDLTMWDVMDVLPELFTRSDLPQGFKWEWLYSALSIKAEQFCTGDDDLGVKYDAWLAEIRRGAVRRPSDGRFFDWISRKPSHRGPGCMGPDTSPSDSLEGASH